MDKTLATADLRDMLSVYNALSPETQRFLTAYRPTRNAYDAARAIGWTSVQAECALRRTETREALVELDAGEFTPWQEIESDNTPRVTAP